MKAACSNSRSKARASKRHLFALLNPRTDGSKNETAEKQLSQPTQTVIMRRTLVRENLLPRDFTKAFELNSV
jgi:hypothetical protein